MYLLLKIAKLQTNFGFTEIDKLMEKITWRRSDYPLACRFLQFISAFASPVLKSILNRHQIVNFWLGDCPEHTIYFAEKVLNQSSSSSMIGSEIGESDFAIGPTPPCFTLGGNINLFLSRKLFWGKEIQALGRQTSQVLHFRSKIFWITIIQQQKKDSPCQTYYLH